MKEKSCSTCKFIDREFGEMPSRKVRVCRRFPPTAVNDDARDQFFFVWPEISRDDWCGEYERDTDDNDGAPL